MPNTYRNATHGYSAYSASRLTVVAPSQSKNAIDIIENEYLDYISWLLRQDIDKVPAKNLLVQLNIINYIVVQPINPTPNAISDHATQIQKPVNNYLKKITAQYNAQLDNHNKEFQMAALFGSSFAIAASVAAGFLMGSWPIATGLKFLIGLAAALIGGALGGLFASVVSKRNKELSPTLTQELLPNSLSKETPKIEEWVESTPMAKLTANAMLITQYNRKHVLLATWFSDLTMSGHIEDDGVDLKRLQGLSQK